MERFVVVLLVEDSAADRAFATEVLKDTGLSIKLCCAGSGEEALRFLRHEGAHDGSPRPDLVLLDLGLPRMTGQDVLAEMKADPTLQAVPVVVLTNSDDDRSELRSFDLGARDVVVKPLDRDAVMEAIQTVTQFA